MASTYKLVDLPAVVREKSTLKWSLVNINAMTTDAIFANYIAVELPLLDVYDHIITVDLFKYEAYLRDASITLQSWLDSLAGASLQILHSGAPVLNQKTVNYVPLWQNAAAKATLCKRDWNPTNTPSLEDADDVIVEWPGLTPQYLKERSLWLVNGYVVPTTYHTYGLRLLNAGDIVRRSRQMSISCLNFENVGKLEYQQLDTTSVFKQEGFANYADGVLIKTSKPIGKRTVGLILGGYLHLLDGSIKQVGPNTIEFIPNKQDIFNRLMQSDDFLEMEFMGVSGLDKSELVKTITKDENWLAYLTSKYSQLVFISTDKLYRDVAYPDPVTRPGSFIVDKDTNLGLLVDQYGKGLCYWPRYEAGLWSLNTEDDWQHNYLANTTQWTSETRINDGLIGANRKKPVQAKLYQYTTRI